MNSTVEIKYSNEHVWARVETNKIYIGITDFAQKALGDIVFVELPEEGTELSAGVAFGVVESVKAASDIYAPISGTVVEVNAALTDLPEQINKNPYESWIIAVEPTNTRELDDLFDADAYERFCTAGV